MRRILRHANFFAELMASDLEATGLTKRETQILDVLLRRGFATAADVQAEIPEAPGYSAVRKLLEILEQRGFVRHEKDGRRFVYFPVAPEQVRKSRVARLLRTLFGGSVERAVAALLDASGEHISDQELARIAQMAEQARRKGPR